MNLANIEQFIQDDWPLLLPVALGFLAVYMLLPRVRHDWLVPGALAGAAALGVGGLLLIQREFATVEAVLFYSFSGIAIVGAGLMLAQHNPVRAALSFALVVLSTCGLFLLLAAPFLMAATIIIYAGAIIITFLFVIMLAQQIGMTSADRRSREPFLASLAGFVLLACLFVVLHRNYDTRKTEERFDSVIEKLQRAVKAGNADEMRRVLETPGSKDYENTLEMEDVKLLLPEREVDITNLEDSLHRRQLEDARAFCKDFVATLEERRQKARHAVGSLQPGAKLPLSPFSGVPTNEPFPSQAKELLPAGNVAALGRSLFTDYLVAVEIGGLLLLVATIGAIVIAGRRGDKDTGEVLR
jgi:NADH:ubiquinone oxidoreductase subunit 6 (subunit J)